MANSAAGSLSVIDANDDRAVATLAVGANPIGLAVDPANHRVEIIDGTLERLSVVDGLTGTTMATVPVPSPAGVVVAPEAGRIYVTSYLAVPG